MQNNPAPGCAIMVAAAAIIVAAIAAPSVCSITGLLIGDAREVNFWRTAGAPEVASRIHWGMELDDTRRRYYGSSYEDGYPLHWAAAYSADPAVITLLLAQGADIEARSSYQRTPLHWAALSNAEPAITATLLERGADPTARTADGDTACDLANRHDDAHAAVRRLLCR